eukprot:2689757-Pleurochrysis_carterae.AAC.1
MKAAMTEQIWHGNSSFCTPEQLRLQQQLRTRKLKCEMSEDLGARATSMQVLSQQSKLASYAAAGNASVESEQ